MNEDGDRMDFSALDPKAEPERLERARSSIAARVAPALRARRGSAAARPDVWMGLAAWRRPVLAAAALIALVSALALAQARPRAGASSSVASRTGQQQSRPSS